jgi:hypothetical protein
MSSRKSRKTESKESERNEHSARQLTHHRAPSAKANVSCIVASIRHPCFWSGTTAPPEAVGRSGCSLNSLPTATTLTKRLSACVIKLLWNATRGCVVDRPTSGCMNRRDCVYLGGTITLPILGWLFRKPILYFATADDPAGIGVAHVRAGNAWRKLMKGQN